MATSLLKRGENALVIFTYGKYFQKKHDGSGSTGHWAIDEKRKCDKVVIYNRTQQGNQVFVAKRTAITPSKKEAGRFVIQLDEIEYYGCTFFNWLQFSGSRNPIRYFSIASQSRKRRANNGDELGMNLALLPFVE